MEGCLKFFFEKYIDEMNWHNLSRNDNLSEVFFEKHINDINWNSFLGSIFNLNGVVVKLGKKSQISE